ncbi:MAG: hypothetical protein DHS20C12_30570 [Pseudohongiella sp.]|nr:MAG: hypothetical protein DHS20C12_30570 [Pseudohongiella sp.]
MSKHLITLLLSLMLAACSVTDGLLTADEAPTTTFQPSEATLSVDGPFEVAAYSDLALNPAFRAATIYHPLETPGRIGIVAIAPGLGERQRHINWWGPRLASHGYAVLVMDTNTGQDDPEMRARALLAAIDLLKQEGRREHSPLFGRVDENKVALMGHSVGGGGALIAADSERDSIQAVIPLTPWVPLERFENITAPTLIVASENDRIASIDQHAWLHYQSIPDSVPAVYIELAEGDHFIANTGSTDLPSLGRFVVAWLKLYLDRDEGYRELLYGETLDTGASRFSRYVYHP